MTQDGGDNLESEMHGCWAAWVLGFMSPVADTTYMLDPQWVNKSKDMNMVIMEIFWDIAKYICCEGHGPGKGGVK